MMRDSEVIDRFKKKGALLEGHFVLSSGLHSSVYLQCAIALQSTRDVIEAGSIIDRSGGQADVGVPRVSLATLDVPAVSPDDCDACKRGDLAIKPGSRKTNLAV